MAERRPLTAGATVGILGGGQLGRMLALAAAELGLATHVYSPDKDSPAFEVAKATSGVDIVEDKMKVREETTNGSLSGAVE